MPVFIEQYVVVGGKQELDEAAELWRFGPKAWKPYFNIRDPQTIQRSIHVMAIPEKLEKARNEMRSYIEAGATHLILMLRAPYPEGIVHRLDEEIIQPLQAECE